MALNLWRDGSVNYKEVGTQRGGLRHPGGGSYTL